ncbi:putative DNA repair protein RecA [Toxoplasma gondii FOU]|uniref:Putative DNA repair protein RecA n=1 Tax=Toxoplasma gondii FOU TaxID=943167 RepID=A0A086JQM8_TOXGO|nr:putative DNA repair protein RecA [Toxoplasma gondii FOU]
MADSGAAGAVHTAPSSLALAGEERVLPASSDGRFETQGESAAFFEAAQSIIRLAATGSAAPADISLPWPPPAYACPLRTATEILASGVSRHLESCPLPVGCRAVDHHLNGGVPRGMLVEISGKAGCGKTQFALSLVAETLLRSGQPEESRCSAQSDEALAPRSKDAPFNAFSENSATDPTELQTEADKPTAAFYIHTEGGFPVQRLHEIMSARRVRHECGFDSTVPAAKALMQRVFMEEVSTEEELWVTLTRRLPRLFLSYRVALIVIDSIAAVFRLPASRADGVQDLKGSDAKHKVSGLVDRATKLMRIGAILRRFAASHGACCLVLNQVSDVTDEEDNLDLNVTHSSHATAYERSGTDPEVRPRSEATSPRWEWRSVATGIDGELVWSSRQMAPRRLLFGGEDPRVRPALGCTWSNCVDCRMMIHRMEQRYMPFLPHSAEGEGPTVLGPLRCLRVVFGSGLDNATDIFFRIDTQGIVDP